MRSFLSSVGIGSATVDTILESDALEPGATVPLKVKIEGGSTPQEVDSIYFALETGYRSEDGGRETATLKTATAREQFTIDPGESRAFPASMTLPRVTPLTKGNVSVWLKTGLEIDWAKDPTDRDHIEVVPTEKMAAVLRAVEGIGFTFSECDCKQASLYSDAPFVQEFEFEPTNSEWRRKIDELELVFATQAESFEVRVEVDRRESVYTEMTGSEEPQRWYTVEHTDTDRLRRDMRSLIDANF